MGRRRQAAMNLEQTVSLPLMQSLKGPVDSETYRMIYFRTSAKAAGNFLSQLGLQCAALQSLIRSSSLMVVFQHRESILQALGWMERSSK